MEMTSVVKLDQAEAPLSGEVTSRRAGAKGIGPSSVPKRLYDVASLRPDGSEVITQFRLPCLPLFDSAFSAIARGTTLVAPDGDIAVEDLRPGDALWTTSGTPAQVMWIGSGTFFSAERSARPIRMFRVMAGAFGQSRPEVFVTLGEHARILQTPVHLRHQSNEAKLLTPIVEFEDGMNVIEVTPPSPVQLFHIVLDRHAAIRAGGLEIETFHPGNKALRSTPNALRDLFLSVFPHIRHPVDFGPLAHPRAEARDPELVAAGYL